MIACFVVLIFSCVGLFRVLLLWLYLIVSRRAVLFSVVCCFVLISFFVCGLLLCLCCVVCVCLLLLFFFCFVFVFLYC